MSYQKRDNLLKARKKRLLSQEEVASAIGIKRVFYNRIENGKSDPQLTIVKKLAVFFEESMDELFS
ncbi:helix-turn-helix transcriptional regulator [Priestia megaterium]|uniref:helix-turn-helix transcriptional regulator n=1 Tax=Priestia megaterium TaxID=1404 RepID=UPI0025B14668|nr:helix-turn-helix transcriptional regulator [Priestia megaterium]MDN3365400.1 helix-turn-helix transcriptional regulator [Priestia megaterium]